MTDSASAWSAIGLLGPGIWIAALVGASGVIAALMPLFGRGADCTLVP